jgi:hypothetical protein
VVPRSELAGLDPGQVLADAIAERDLTGARDVPAVLDARLRRRTGALLPRPAGPWSAQLPDIADLERWGFAAQIGALMYARKEQRAKLTLTAGEEIPELGQWISDLAGQRREFARRLAERQSLMTPVEDPDYEYQGPAFPAWQGTAKDAILTAQTGDPAVAADPGTRHGPRPGHGSRRMTAPGARILYPCSSVIPLPGSARRSRR